MKRLTKRIGGYIQIKGCKTVYTAKERAGSPASNAIVRLAAYEDTWLTPEEVNDLKTVWDMYGGEEGITAMLEELEQLRKEPRKEPPNDPLALEELQEMDGEPVWNATIGKWALVTLHHRYGPRTVRTVDGEELWRDLDDRYYRRKPEE